MQNEWRDFNGGAWENEVNVRDFIQRNYKPYDGDSSFLEGPTEDTTALWQDVLELSKQEREAGGVLDMDKVTDDYKELYDTNGGNTHLDGAYSTAGTGHTVFAQVFDGMDVVRSIMAVETDSNDKPLEDVTILSAEIVPYE